MQDTNNTKAEEAEKMNRWNSYVGEIPVVGKLLLKKERVAVLRMAGVIADSSVMRRAGINFQKFREPIAEAFDLPRAKAVAIIINSPGGAPAQCSLISKLVRDLSAEKKLPVYVFIEDVAASGGYWLSCMGDEIYAQETSIVGSIGVISSGFGLDEFIAKHDVTRRVHTSGRDKSFLDPFKPEKAEDVSRLKDIQRKMHESFKEWVRERRAGKLNADENELMEGAFWTGGDALQHGLIDGIGDVVSVMKEKFGEEISFVECTPEKKGILSAILPFAGESRMDIGAVIETAEEKSVWGRFGL